jgi:hypothetical protein
MMLPLIRRRRHRMKMSSEIQICCFFDCDLVMNDVFTGSCLLHTYVVLGAVFGTPVLAACADADQWLSVLFSSIKTHLKCTVATDVVCMAHDSAIRFYLKIYYLIQLKLLKLIVLSVV